MSRALLKYVRVSPNKARLIAREIKGMNAELALASLEFMPNKAAGIISKVIASAVANGDYEPEEVIITSCRVEKATVMKRWRPRARGTASRILKPTAHILVEVGEAPATTEGKTEKKEAPKKAEKKKPVSKKVPEKKSKAKVSSSKADTKKSKTTGDDLTKIKGIGKVYASKLEAEGVKTIKAVANMTQKQIDTMEEKYSFKGDFKDSIEDAKNLLKAKEA